MAMKEETKMEKIISLAKRRGFVYQGSEIYGGLAGMWDYGPYGVELRNNIKNLWWRKFVTDRDDMYGVDAAILMNQKVWKASGHIGGFSDPLVECKKCKHRFREDQLEEENRKSNKCPDCEGQLAEARQFNMMFKTHVGAIEDEDSISYLRPETAQGMFVNFKNVFDSFHPKLPFGLAQIGKAFRNEIAPRDFIFRLRELEQMEIEYFVDPRDQKKVGEMFDTLFNEQMSFLKDLGLSDSKIHKIEVPDSDRAFYSKRSVDTEFDFPFGQKELLGIAYRTDHDLKAHIDSSKVDLSYYDEDTKERIIPHCIEPTFGVDRLMLAVLSDAYTEDEIDGEKRVYLKFTPKVAPVKVAVFPLLKNKPHLVEKAREIYQMLKKEFSARGISGVVFDDNGNIGKRYRRQDEIGTPYCVTVDFDTVEKDAGVTVRDRDSGKQERVEMGKLVEYLTDR
jgi:glycyl-tRNA synthetase